MSSATAMLYGPRVAEPLGAAEWIKKLRDVYDLTQDQLAEQVGRDRTTIARWETDVHELSFESVRLVLTAFPDAGAIFAGNTTAKRPVVAPLKTLEAREIAGLVDKQPPIRRIYIRDMVYRLLGKGRPNES